MKHAVVGLVAHVDAGKTTLAEAMLYQTGALRKRGRVDHGDTLLDNHALERERGITIFAGQASLQTDRISLTLLDTPGHVDFSAETERILGVLDYAILVLSGLDGVQAHTETLWRLLAHYRIPTLLFVTKMDLSPHAPETLTEQLRERLSDRCVSFGDPENERNEQLALCSETLLETFLEQGDVPEQAVAAAVRAREVFPCFFGSGLKGDGICELLDALGGLLTAPVWPERFGARVFKITHDAQGTRLTHLKVTGGCLRARDTILCGDREEKAIQLRLYQGTRFTVAEQVEAGQLCAVQGFASTHAGQGLGLEAEGLPPLLEPVMRYRIILPPDCDPRTLLPKLRALEEEDPLLHLIWDSRTQTLHVELMGRVQAEVLCRLIEDRFGVQVSVAQGTVLYRETIENTVEGVGHYEPLRHYAEVHLLLEPLARGSGIVLESRVSEDLLDRNWQRLIRTHLAEKQHLGVLTGSPLTDVRITLAVGRAHLKHTEGGDFRQATYRAVRQGLMQARSVLLEPYYAFRLLLPPELIGRAITDVHSRFGSFEPPEPSGPMTLLCGRVPVSTFGDYAAEVASYSRGLGRLRCTPAGYDVCHNTQEVVAAVAYDPEADQDNPPHSVFCAHGGGFTVRWNEVAGYMHLESVLKPELPEQTLRRRRFSIDDAELQAIMEREFGKPKQPPLPQSRQPEKASPQPQAPAAARETTHLIVDGYNVVFAWEELRELARTDLEGARARLGDLLHSYAAFTGIQTVLVFDAYRVPGGEGSRQTQGQLHTVFTKERETADAYIERLVHEIGKNEGVLVVTSDGLIQLSALRTGVRRISAREFAALLDEAFARMEALREAQSARPGTVGDRLSAAKAKEF